MRSPLPSLLAAILVISSPHAAAGDTDAVADVHCLIVGMKLAEVPDEESSGQMLSTYYLGRLNTHIPKIDVGALFVREFDALTPSALAADATRCSAEFAVVARQIAQMAKDVRRAADAAKATGG